MPRNGARNATIYDAVAERLSYEGFIDPHHAGLTGAELDQATLKSLDRAHPVAPDEALFRSQKAPDRDEENDIYDSAKWLEPGQLPDPDLLKAIHAYVSDFYSRATFDRGKYDMRSLDETALIACGVLLEEACKDLLGETGDRVFTEADSEGFFSDHGGMGSDGGVLERSPDGAPPAKRRRVQKRIRAAMGRPKRKRVRSTGKVRMPRRPSKVGNEDVPQADDSLVS